MDVHVQRSFSPVLSEDTTAEAKVIILHVLLFIN